MIGLTWESWADFVGGAARVDDDLAAFLQNRLSSDNALFFDLGRSFFLDCGSRRKGAGRREVG